MESWYGSSGKTCREELIVVDHTLSMEDFEIIFDLAEEGGEKILSLFKRLSPEGNGLYFVCPIRVEREVAGEDVEACFKGKLCRLAERIERKTLHPRGGEIKKRAALFLV